MVGEKVILFSSVRGVSSLQQLELLLSDELEPEAHDLSTEAVAEFGQWIANMRQRGLITFEEQLPTYVGPGIDPSTEDLRSIVRLYYNESPEVPEDPSGELYILGAQSSAILWLLGSPVNAE